jgi:hypothetical protein
MEAKIIQIIKKARRKSFEKINNMDKPTAKLTKRKRKKTQVYKIRSEKRKCYHKYQ